MASGGRQMPVVGEGRQKERGPAGNRPRARGKSKRRGKSTARAPRWPLRVGNRPRESLTASAGEGRGREKAVGLPRAPLGCSSARVHRPVTLPRSRPCISASWQRWRLCISAHVWDEVRLLESLLPPAVRTCHSRPSAPARFESPPSPVRTCPSA